MITGPFFTGTGGGGGGAAEEELEENIQLNTLPRPKLLVTVDILLASPADSFAFLSISSCSSLCSLYESFWSSAVDSLLLLLLLLLFIESL
jgi:hypothetical protein